MLRFKLSLDITISTMMITMILTLYRIRFGICLRTLFSIFSIPFRFSFRLEIKSAWPYERTNELPCERNRRSAKDNVFFGSVEIQFGLIIVRETKIPGLQRIVPIFVRSSSANRRLSSALTGTKLDSYMPGFRRILIRLQQSDHQICVCDFDMHVLVSPLRTGYRLIRLESTRRVPFPPHGPEWLSPRSRRAARALS